MPKKDLTLTMSLAYRSRELRVQLRRGDQRDMAHRQILPIAIGLVIYGFVRSWVNSVFTSFGFPFA